MRLVHPRIPPLPQEQWSGEIKELMAGLEREGRIFNIFATLARHPALLRRWLVFGNHVLAKSTLPPRERELAILRMGWLCRAEYEWGHHVAMGKDAGITADEIRRVATGANAPGWSPFEAALLRAVHEIEQLLLIVALGQGLPSRIVDERIRVQLVYCPQQRSFKRAPARCVGTCGNSPDLIRRDSGVFSHGHVMPPLIFCAAQPTHAQNGQLSLPRRERRFGKHMIAKHQPPS